MSEVQEYVVHDDFGYVIREDVYGRLDMNNPIDKAIKQLADAMEKETGVISKSFAAIVVRDAIEDWTCYMREGS